MSNDPSPLKYLGTQSQETVSMEAALAREAARADQAARLAIDPLADELDRSGSRAADAGSKIGDAANWAVAKARDAAQAATQLARRRATKAVESYTRDDPVRAILVAAGTGALLAVLVATMARSGARSLRRKVHG